MLERHTQLTLNIVYFAAQFGHENIFRVDTRERQFYMQAISAEDMEEWLSHIKTALQEDCTPALRHTWFCALCGRDNDGDAQSRGAGSNMPAAGESTIGQAMAIADMESSETGGYESGGYTGAQMLGTLSATAGAALLS